MLSDSPSPKPRRTVGFPCKACGEAEGVSLLMGTYVWADLSISVSL